MGNFFCKQKKEKQEITSRDRAVLDLKVQRDRLKQYRKKIRVILDRETEVAKEQLRLGNKNVALLALKKKKYQEGLLESTNSQLLNLEQLTSNIEFTQVEQQVFQGLQKGNQVLSELQNEMSLEDVEKLMSETSEAIAYQNEISAMLSGKLTEQDEEELENELQALQMEVIEGEMPAVPVKETPKVKEDTVEDVEKDETQIDKKGLLLA